MTNYLMSAMSAVVDYFKENKTMFWIAVALAAAIVVVAIVLIVLGVRRSKAKKRAQAKPKTVSATTVNAAQTQTKAQEEKTAEEKEAARQATLARLEQERLAAEKEEAKLAAAAEKEAAEKAAAEKAEKEKTAVEEKKQPAKTAKAKTVKAKAEKQEKPAEAKKTAAKAKATPVEEDEDETEKAAKYSGKWTIFRVLTEDQQDDPEEEMYFFELRASNGEKLLSSEEYTSYNGALRGIETHKANIEKGNFKITVSKKGDFIFKLLSGKNMLLCMGENYPTKARCESAIESTKRFAKTAVVDENVQDHIIKAPVEDDTELPPLPEEYNGKWLILSDKDADGEDVFRFELYANNGEKLLTSEEYTTYIGAVNGIQTHKTNIEKGNLRISLTKKGDYIYKLLNGNGQLLCLGEHYKTRTRCQNAVDSVKRFAKNAPILTDSENTK